MTVMTGGRDLVHADHYVRLAGVQYVKDCLSLAASMGGRILTVRPEGWERPVELGAEFIHEGNPELWRRVRRHLRRPLRFKRFCN